jgi:hypothetical protein
MTDSHFTDAISRIASNKFPDMEDAKTLSNLVPVWAEVLETIIDRSQNEFRKQETLLHIDLKPEMTMSLINTVQGLAKNIVEARTVGRTLADISPEEEREFHSSDAGRKLIKGTAKVMTTAWLKRYQVRWEPKSKKKLENEKNPPPPKPRSVKEVDTNHFISRFFLKRYWAENGNLTVARRGDSTDWKIRKLPFGKWGHQKDLYSDRLEDRFSLIEGDAEKPIRKVIDLIPLNDPERLAFLGYLIVQKLRNPFYRRQMIEGVLPVSTREVGAQKANDPDFQRDAYEAIFENNELYDRISHPLLWSKWVMVRATNPVFVLPDTACILSAINGRGMLVAPLSPTDCFIATGIEENEKRVVPYEINSDELTELISAGLSASCNTEIVCHSTFQRKAVTGRLDDFLGATSRIVQKTLKEVK